MKREQNECLISIFIRVKNIYLTCINCIFVKRDTSLLNITI